MYESSGTPTRTTISRPSGSVAVCSIGSERRVIGGVVSGVTGWLNPTSMPPERVVLFRPRTILSILGILILVGIVLWVVWIARHVLTWVLISLFLAMAIN